MALHVVLMLNIILHKIESLKEQDCNTQHLLDYEQKGTKPKSCKKFQ